MSSTKPIAKKLFIKENYRVLLINEPDGYIDQLGEIPSGVKLESSPNGETDLIQFFVTSRAELEANLLDLKTRLTPNGLLWVTYPKGSSKMNSDINRDSINEYAQSIGLTGVAMVSIDATWSALRLKIV